jgi:hypothetical protein
VLRQRDLFAPAVPSPDGRFAAVAALGRRRLLFVPLHGGPLRWMPDPSRYGVPADWTR